VEDHHCLEKAEINQSLTDAPDAYDRYEEFVSKNFCKLSYRIDRNQNFKIHSTLHSLDGFMVGRFTTTGGKGDLVRTRAGIAEDARGRFALYIPMRGDLELMQFDRTEYCRPGSMAVLSISVLSATRIYARAPFLSTPVSVNLCMTASCRFNWALPK